MPDSVCHASPLDLRPHIPNHAEYFARWASQSACVLEQLRCETDYYYGSSPEETLDYFPARHANAPLFIFIPGIAWWNCQKNNFAFLAPNFLNAGISLAIINHRPQHSSEQADYPEVIRQLLRACVWLWHNAPDLGADPNRMFIGGHASGATFAAMLLAAHWPSHLRGLPDRLLRGGLCLSGLYDLAAPNKLNDLQATQHVSPAHYFPLHPIPLITVVGGQENQLFQEQNILLKHYWPHCSTHTLNIPDRNHLSLVETLTDHLSPVFLAAQKLILT